MISAILFAAAMDILANCRAMLPAEPVTMKGEIVLRNRRGIPSGEYGYTLRSDRTKTPAKLSLEFREQDSGKILEKHEILRPGPVPEGKVLSGWFVQSEDEAGNTTYTRVFQPDETGAVQLPTGYTLEPMVLYALFEEAK